MKQLDDLLWLIKSVSKYVLPSSLLLLMAATIIYRDPISVLLDQCPVEKMRRFANDSKSKMVSYGFFGRKLSFIIPHDQGETHNLIENGERSFFTRLMDYALGVETLVSMTTDHQEEHINILRNTLNVKENTISFRRLYGHITERITTLEQMAQSTSINSISVLDFSKELIVYVGLQSLGLRNIPAGAASIFSGISNDVLHAITNTINPLSNTGIFMWYCLSAAKTKYASFIRTLMRENRAIIENELKREDFENESHIARIIRHYCRKYNKHFSELLDEPTIWQQAIAPIMAFDNLYRLVAFAIATLSEKHELREMLKTYCMEKSDLLGDFDSLNAVPKINQFYLECLRYYMPIPMLYRRATEDMKTVKGGVIPKGAHYIIDFFSPTRNPEEWLKSVTLNPPLGNLNLNEFDLINVEHGPKPQAFPFMPFSVGSHKCLGKAFSEVLFKQTMFVLLRNYNFSMTEGCVLKEALKNNYYGFTELSHDFKVNFSKNIVQEQLERRFLR